MKEIYNKLLAIQQDLNAPKNQRNEFGKYNYRSCEDILQAVKPLLHATRTVLRLSDHVTEIGGRVYVAATATLIDVDSGDYIDSEAFAREEETKKGMDASQITGAASSYARKYALNGLFAIDDNKDSDFTNTRGKETPKPAPKDPEPVEDVDGYYICQDCGGVISGVKTQSGKQLTPHDVAVLGLKKYGVQVCQSCGKLRAEAARYEN